MPTALEILFDGASTASVIELWTRLDAAGLDTLSMASHGRHRPHVTLLNASTLDISPALVNTLQPLVGTELCFDSLAIFPGATSVLFLAARVTLPLLRTHAAVHELVPVEQTELWAQYRPGAWVPHCTLAFGLDATMVRTAFGLLHPFSSMCARVAEIAAVNTETGDQVRLTS